MGVVVRFLVFLLGMAFFMAGQGQASAGPRPASPSLQKKAPFNEHFKTAHFKTVPNAKNPYGPLVLHAEGGRPASLPSWWSSIAQDSTTHVIWQGGKARLSYDFAAKLAERRGFGGVHGGRRKWRRDFANDLSQATGIAFRSDDPAYAAYDPDDTWFKGSPQWALLNPGLPLGGKPGRKGYDIGITRVWDKWGGNDSMVIAVVDAGFHFAHPDLQGRWFVNKTEADGAPGIDDDGNGFVDDTTGWDFVEGDADVSDGNGHGTQVASIIAAGFDNGKGIAGMLPEAKVLPIRVLDAAGRGEQSDIAAGIQYAVAMGVDVINFSIGGASDGADLRSAFAAARDKGIPIVVAAGNEGADLDTDTPAPMNYGFDNVIVVAAVNHAGEFSEFSNFGAKTVDLAAPGENVLTCGVGDRAELFKEDFEADEDSGQVTGNGLDTVVWEWSNLSSFRVTTVTPLEGKQSLEWVSGATASFTTRDFIDLHGKIGGQVWLQMQFTPANSSDGVIIEALREGDSRWVTVTAAGGTRIDEGVGAGLTGFDGTRFKLRIRTTAVGSVTARRLRLDFIYVSHLRNEPLGADDPASYPVAAGTSIAAPHVSAYVALLKVACKRMGVPFNRERVLAGAVPDTACAGRTRSGGRLDMYQGLAFYLETLPALQLIDSTRLTWLSGEEIVYTLRVGRVDEDSASDTRTGWSLAVNGLGPSVRFDASSGKLVWTEGLPADGLIDFKAQAKGATVLRRRFQFQATVQLPVALSGVRLNPNDLLRLKVRKNLRSLGMGIGREGLGNRQWVLGRGLPPASFASHPESNGQTPSTSH